MRRRVRFDTGAITIAAIAICSVGLLIRTARADRIVLAPAGTTLPENSYLTEIAIDTSIKSGEYTDYGWFAYSSGDGIELEINRYEANTERNKQWSMNIENPMPTLHNLPAISLGIRDLTGTGTEHGALYLAATRSIAITRTTHTLFRAINISAGAGTGTIGGAFVGVQTRLAGGLSVSAEIYRHRPNVSIGLGLLRNLQLKAYSLNGGIFYGIKLTVSN